MKKLFGENKRAVLYKCMLLIIDAVLINVATYLTFLVRFEMSFGNSNLEYIESAVMMLVINTIVTLILFRMFRLYNSLWRFASVKELINIIFACLFSAIFNIICYMMLALPIFRSYFVIYFIILFIFTCSVRFSYRLLRLIYRGNYHTDHMRNTMIIGAGEACNMIMKELELSTELDAKICCVIDDDINKQGTYIHGVKIVGGKECILKMVEKYNINEIIIAVPSASREQKQEILAICQKAKDCDLKILPGMYQLVKGSVSVSNIRQVNIEDLLGREVIRVESETVGRYVSGKVVMVTGGGGSIGSELCRQLVVNGVTRLIIFDVYENNAYDIQQELRKAYPNLDLIVLIGSVRNSRKVEKVFAKFRPDIVYHAAAHKHVPLMEISPNEAIKNNVFGTYNVAMMADKYQAEKFVLISTDKAVNPTNIMGASKRICEMIIQLFSRHSNTEFAAVRFGNVLGSNGSVIPLFKKQIEAGGPVTVTHPEIIRYFMTIPEAVSLVLKAGASAKGGEIFVLDMGVPVKIADLARNLIELSGYVVGKDIEIKYTGLRPGEKLYEELLMDEEGLEDTENQLIHIGKPIDFNEQTFIKDLEQLYYEAYSETNRMKSVVARIVPIYHLCTEDMDAGDDVSEKLKQDFEGYGKMLKRVWFQE